MGACINKVLCMFVPFQCHRISLHRPVTARIERDQVGNGDEIVLLGAGEAKRKLYEVRLDPQYWYDKAIERSWDFRWDFRGVKMRGTPGCPQNQWVSSKKNSF